MRLLVVWLIVGVPSLLIAVAMVLGRSPLRAVVGYALLALGFAVLTATDRVSGAVFGGLLALLYAAGRGADSDAGGRAAGSRGGLGEHADDGGEPAAPPSETRATGRAGARRAVAPGRHTAGQ